MLDLKKVPAAPLSFPLEDDTVQSDTGLEVLIFPHPFLKKVAKPVETFDEGLKIIVREMLATMYRKPGIGLAALQVGIDQRLFVMDTQYKRSPSSTDSDEWSYFNFSPKVFVNPEIIKGEGEILYEEGCLSTPGVFEKMKRFEQIVLKYQDLKGETKEELLTGIDAICAQHERDHLDGITFIEKLSSLKLQFYKQKLIKLKKRHGK